MPNAWFQFKQFKIVQDKCAMKVGTDGVLLGAWAPVHGVESILDVGSGTGLIALMLAQRVPDASITAVEIDKMACLQSMENIHQSPWSDRMEVVHDDFKQFSRRDMAPFDLIVSNPPYFVDSKPSFVEARNMARHTIHLNHKELVEGAVRLLKPRGQLAIVLPTENYQLFSDLALRSGLFELRRLNVYPTPQKPASRILSLWSRYLAHPCEMEEMVLEENGRHKYSAEYLALTRDFYLKS